jgi:hypothetical protein
MERRQFLKTSATAGLLGSSDLLEPLPKAEPLASDAAPIPRRNLGMTGEQLSMIGFTGIVVMENGPSFARNIVAEAVNRGIHYCDVAPTYGNAQGMKIDLSVVPSRDSEGCIRDWPGS